MEPRRSGTTTAAGIVAIAVSVVVSMYGVLAVIVGLVAREASTSSDGLVEDFGDTFAGFLLIGGTLVLATAAWGVAIGVGVLTRRRWARVAGIVTFSILAASAGLFVIDGLGDGSAGDDLEYVGLLIAAANLGVVGLLSTRSAGRELRAADRHDPAREARPFTS